MLSFIQFIVEQNNPDLANHEDISHYQKVGERRGSNPGGVYKNPQTGSLHYVKHYRNPQQAATEVASSHVYDAVGVPHLKPRLASHNGQTALMTDWRSDLKPVTPNYSNWSDQDKGQLAKHYVAAIATKNWDAVGLEHDNVMRDPHGSLHSVDLGGTMRFRAMGGPKDFGSDVAEHDSLLNKDLPAGQAFSQVKREHVRAAVQGTNIDRDSLVNHFKASGLHDPESHADAVVGRINALKERYK